MNTISAGTAEWYRLLQDIKNDNSSIQKFDFIVYELNEGNHINELAEALKTNTYIIEFDFMGSNLGDDAIQVLAPIFQTRANLVSLNFIGNQIGPQGAKALAIALQNKKALTKLFLDNNQIGDKGIKYLVPALQTNTSLISLKLSKNQIGSDGIIALSLMLQSNKALAFLALGCNQIGDDGIQVFATFLQRNTSLSTLLLHKNKIGKRSVEILAPVIQANNSLTILNIQQNEFDLNSILYKELEKYIERNKNSQKQQDQINPLKKIKMADELKQDVKIIKKENANNKEIDCNDLQINNNNPSKLSSMVTEKGEITISIAISFQALSFGKKLGSGGFGTVFQGEYVYNKVAIKLLQNLSASDLEAFRSEASLMARLHSQYVVHFYGACFEKPHYGLVMEYMPKGSLFHFLHNKKLIENNILYQIGVDVSCGVAFLHVQNVVHGDLKSLNILLDDSYHAKIADFGLAKLKLANSIGTVMGPSMGGSTRWMAPELFTEEDAKTTKASDVYSFGVILWELGSRKIPFEQKAPRPEKVPFLVTQEIREDISPNTLYNFPKMAKLISRCWTHRADDRPTMDEAVKELRQEQQNLFEMNM